MKSKLNSVGLYLTVQVTAESARWRTSSCCSVACGRLGVSFVTVADRWSDSVHVSVRVHQRSVTRQCARFYSLRTYKEPSTARSWIESHECWQITKRCLFASTKARTIPASEITLKHLRSNLQKLSFQPRPGRGRLIFLPCRREIFA